MAASEQLRISQVGLVARSPEGHAARGMAIKGREDLWVEIQANTFRNWVNEHLRTVGTEVRDLVADFCDGTRLCALVEVLQKRPLRPSWIQRPANQHQYLENVATALTAIAADGVKLVNIGNVDIVNGNLKLILGLIWSLIVRYQIGRSKFPPKKLMLAWLKAVLPECRVSNFTTDWNSGVYLSALLDYCRPGLFPHWRNLNPKDSVDNCHRAMEIARREFQIPMVLEPEYLASPFLDELSGMTYLSYFMKEDSPGFHATLRWVNNQIPDTHVKNFTRDWNDGTVLCKLVRSLGGPIPGYDQLTTDYSSWEKNLNKGIHGGEKLGVEPILKAKDMADKNVEHLGVMAYAANFQWIQPRQKPGDRLTVSYDCHTAKVNKPAVFKLEYLPNDVDPKEVTAEVIGPSGKVECRLQLSNNGGRGSFIPTEIGMHKLIVYNEGEVAKGCPINIRVTPELTKISFPGMDPCAIGSIVEVLINSNGASSREIDVLARSPTGRGLSCPVQENNGVYTATFQPDEAGEWSIAVTHGGEHIQGGPFTCFVFDPNAIKLRGLEGATPGQPFNFTVDASGTGGLGDVCLDIVSGGRSVPHRMEPLGGSMYRVSLVPQQAGKHRVYVYFNGSDVKGSPFPLRVGSQHSRDKSNSPTNRRSSSSHNQESWTQDRSTHQDNSRSSIDQRLSRTHITEERIGSPSYGLTNGRGPSPIISNSSPSPVNSPLYRDSPIHGSRFSPIYKPNASPTFRTPSSPSQSPTGFKTSSSPLLNNSNVYKSSPSPAHSPLGFKHSPSPVGSPTFQHNGGNHSESTSRRFESHGMRRGSVDGLDEGKGGAVDTTSNVKVSAVLGGSNLRADSWDAIAKTKSLLSYGSLESLANLTAKSEARKNEFSHHKSTVHQINSTSTTAASVDEVDAVHSRFRGSSPSPGGSHQYSNVINQRNNGGLLIIGSRNSPTENGTGAGSVPATVTGDALKLVPVNRQVSIDIELPNSADLSEVTVTVTAPSHRNLPVKLYRNRDHISANFTATEIGEHIIDIKVRDQKVIGAPFRTHAYNARAIQVGRIPNGVLGQPVEFEIDGSGAGSGNLEILVNGGHVTSFVRNLGNQRFLASFVPHEVLSHLVEMKFNGETVPGSPWQVGVMTGPKMAVLGEAVRLVGAGTTAVFEFSALGFSRDDIDIQIISPSKRPVTARLVEEKGGEFRVEFTPTEVGSHLVEVSVAGQKLPAGPLVAKVYNSALIRVTDVGSGVVGQPCQFRVDASQAGEGQLEISINEGEVPNHVQVVGGGRCLVSFTPEQTKPHLIDIKFNGETVTGCPFVCSVSDTSRVSLTLRNLELIPVNEIARFHMGVDGSGSAELAVSVRGPTTELPVKVTGNIHSGFTAEFTPRDVGAHSITVEYNGHPVSGTPFVAKAYDAKRVFVGPLPKGSVGKTLQFMVDASQAGEGNLEITISARGHNIPTQVHPQGNARFAVSFVPIESTDHVISINFNKESVPGSPFLARVQGDSPHQILVSGPSLSSAAVGKTSFFTVSNVAGSVEDIEVNVEGPNGQSVPAQVKDTGSQTFQVEFSPRVAGEHRIAVAYRKVAIAGSPFSCKVYDVKAIKVKDVAEGIVAKPITFIVETSQAGPGNLEVTVNGGRVPTSAQAQGPHTYAISFTPREAIAHTVDLRFNGEDVPGSPFTCQVSEAARVVISGDGLEKVAVNRAAMFCVEADPSLGRPDVQVLSPSRRPLTVDVGVQTAGGYIVHFTPTDVGDHSVEVKLAGVHIEGSPFLIKAYDAAKVKVTDINSGVVGKPVFFSINASQAGAGNLEIIVSVSGHNVPNYVQSEGNAKFRVNFKPQEAAPHSLSVRFNGEPVPGSPFMCKVLDASQILVSGSALKMSPLGQAAVVVVDPQMSAGDLGSCDVTVTSPSGHSIPVRLTKSDKFTAEFMPSEVGRHSVAVILDGEPVKGSPFACNIYDVSKVKITGLGPSKVGKPATFTVDASEAGEGTLELVVSTDKTTVKAEVVACSRGLYDVTFVPHEPVPHFVNISFNEEDVPGSPFKCEVLELGVKEMRHMHRKESRMVTVRGEGLKDVVVGSTAYFDVDPKGMDGRIDMEVTGPHGSHVPCYVKKLASGLYRAEYRPQQVGLHSIIVFHQEQPISKQPFTVEVFDPRQVKIVEMEEAFCHRAASFKVDVSGAGRGVLSASVRAAGQEVKHAVHELDAGQYQVVYHPKLAVPHRIDLKYNGLHTAGCPFEVSVKNPAVGQDVIATGLGLYQSRAGKVTSFVIETLGHPTKEFDVVITGPQGSAVPVRCYQQKDGNLLAEFTAHTAGTYKIDVTQGSRAVRGSPYYCQVFDASKVKIEDVGSKSVAVNEKIAFRLQRREAGFAELDVTVTSPLGQDLPLEVKSCGNDKDCDLIEFCPSLPGNYRFKMTYGGEEILGSPLTFTVEDSGVANASGDGLFCGQVGSPSTFKVVGPGLPGKPTVHVDGPDHVATCSIEREADGIYVVTYTPLEVGVYDVRVDWDDSPIPGSPFHPKIVDPLKVRVIGGWESFTDSEGRLELAVHNTKKISFDTSEAGPGQLTAECRGPSGNSVPIAVEPTSGSRVRLLLTPRTSGEHLIYLQYGGFPLPRSPLLGLADGGLGASSGPVRVVLTGRGLAGARCHEEAEFTIDGSQAGPGLPEVTLTGMKTDIKVQLQNLGNSTYRATYTPTIPGAYLLNVMWSDRQVKGCPLKVAVTAVADAGRVVCSGDGLRVGTVGKEIRSFIDTRRAGPGELTAHCVGPHKVAYCELYDHGDGTFTLNVKPQEAGRHALTIKYDGDHVPGSPFSLRVAGAPDPSKVRVYGPGIEHGVLATFQSRFICDTRGAGAGQLTVRIRGPKGAFRVEMQRESQKDRTILCKFDPTEPGDYRVEVKWAGELVPGSPFIVMIFDTQEELNRFLQGSHSPGSELYGSVGYSTGYAHMNFGGAQQSWRGSQPQL
ncbi:filamin-C isoform X3 [Cryptotermes secundus]|uniref:filamin-C isoform X3 n=1 Tax=Cryptotermes secundus TaxID=105785 RepID=UPI000CD7D370|nr:filamin-C isoform X3 [Cryptotermes secundus]